MSKIKMSYKKWTKEEEKILVDNFYYYSDSELHKLFFTDKTEKAIGGKVRRMKLGSRSPDVWKHGVEKMSNTKKEYYKTHDSYNKGRKFSEESRKKMSDSKKKAGKWKGDTNPRHITPLNGELNGRWKGGAVDLYRELRTEVKDWQEKSMNFCSYHCVITGGEFDNIHHAYPYNKILDETFDILHMQRLKTVSDYSKEEFVLIRQKISELHNIYGYGACLNKDVHKLFHDIYGYMNVGYSEFLDFYYRIDTGEFDDWFLKSNLKINLNYNYINYLENILFIEEHVA